MDAKLIRLTHKMVIPIAHSGRKLHYLLFLVSPQSLETNGLAFTYASVVYVFIHAHVYINLFCTQDRNKLHDEEVHIFKSSIGQGIVNAWDKSQQLIKCGRNA
jgi:hypothetical protein